MSQQVLKMIGNYTEMIQERNVLLGEIATFTGLKAEEIIEAMNYHQPEGERVMCSPDCDRIERIALEYAERLNKMNRDWLVHLQRRYQALVEEIAFFEQAIHALPEDLSGIMWDIVTSNLSWDSIAEKHSVSRSSIGYKRKKAIEALDRLYFKRNQRYADYVMG